MADDVPRKPVHHLSHGGTVVAAPWNLASCVAAGPGRPIGAVSMKIDHCVGRDCWVCQGSASSAVNGDETATSRRESVQAAERTG